MKQRMLILLSLIIIFLYGVAGCSGEDSSSPDHAESTTHGKGTSKQNLRKTPSSNPVNHNHSATHTKKRFGPSVSHIVNHMTLDEKIGQMMLVGIDGTNVDQQTKTLIDREHVGGVILFSKNINTPRQTVQLINQLKAVNGSAGNPLPLFVSVDEEGGEVSRMPDIIFDLPSSGKIGNINDSEFSFEIGKCLGSELNAFGFNMDFAPVLDINNHPGNSVISDRSFGSDKRLVSKLGVATMKGIQTQHVIPVIKHFPGYGAVTTDAHTELPEVNYHFDRLMNVEWVPYKKAISNGADAVMVTHILLPKLDAHHPASLSRKVITGMLRNQLHFNGVVMTDDLMMGAIKKRMPVSKAAVKAVKGGADIVMVAFNPTEEISAFRALKQGVKNGEISEKQINESVTRIMKLKRKFKLSNQPVNNVNVQQLNEKIKAVLDKKF